MALDRINSTLENPDETQGSLTNLRSNRGSNKQPRGNKTMELVKKQLENQTRNNFRGSQNSTNLADLVINTSNLMNQEQEDVDSDEC